MDQLGVARLSEEELLEKRWELAKARSLVLHYEHKNKRLKSRTYRCILKKEKEKPTEGLIGDYVDDEEDQQMKNER